MKKWNRFDFGDFEITKREILVSISIIAVLLLIGFIISGKISDHLMDKNEIILIRGNHEDLMMDLLCGWDKRSYLLSHHRSNKTVDSVLQLTDSHYILDDNKDEVKEKLSNTPFIQKIIPAMVNYYETNKYIFVHGWIPCNKFKENRYCDRYEAKHTNSTGGIASARQRFKQSYQSGRVCS